MPLPAMFEGRLSLPLIGAPQFIVSGPELVIAQCKAGVVGTFPSLNARPIEQLDEWLTRMKTELAEYKAANPHLPVAPFGVNLIVHRSNSRLEEDLELVVKHQVEFIITSVGAPTEIVKAVHGYGGIVFHDVTNIRHAKKALSTGVDGLILVCAGAGGHAGTLSPFALVPEIREMYDGPVVLSGSMSSGQAVRAAVVLGADMGYMGTRFIATQEANAVQGYKDMLVDYAASDIVYTPAFTGIPGNYLRPSIVAAGLDPDNIEGGKDAPDMDLSNRDKTKPKRWKDIWGAGQGLGTIHDIPATGDLIARLAREYQEACGLQAWPATAPAAVAAE